MLFLLATMFEQVKYPQNLDPKALDLLLAKGWFRMGQSIFTTEFVLFQSCVYRTIWLRHDLKKYQSGKSISNLKKRNKNFRIELKRAVITDTHVELFEKYKDSVSFDTAASLHQLLDGYVYIPANIYNTYEINIYDQEQLIACSYFDIGFKSAEGIAAYYHPAYKPHSLGRYLIYLQIEICKKNDFQYYYPGYFVPGFSHLDYKLDIGSHCLEYFLIDDALWYPIECYEDVGIPIEYQDYFIDNLD